jgi:hypothetical protein
MNGGRTTAVATLADQQNATFYSKLFRQKKGAPAFFYLSLSQRSPGGGLRRKLQELVRGRPFANVHCQNGDAAL